MTDLFAELPPARLALVALGYVLGAIPFGVLVTRLVAGTDPRRVGSGNIGATNVARAAGKGAAAATLLLDAAKGFAPALLAAWLVLPRAFVPLPPGDAGYEEAAWWPAAAGFAAFVGHVFPVWLGFRGGKGVATALGVCLALVPLPALAGAAVYAAIFLVTRVSSVGSLGAAAAACGLAFWLAPYPAYAWLVAAMVFLIVVRHAGNIRRILRRSEAGFPR